MSENENSEEGTRLADSISDELENDPPLQCEVSFTWAGGSEEQAQRACLFMRVHAAMLRRSVPDLDFSALKLVTFHDDYELALREAGTRVGRSISPTREPGGFSYAMVVHTIDHCELVADARLAWGMLSDDDIVRDFHMNVLRHELAHVADYARHVKVWPDEWMSARLTGLRRHFFPIAHSSWSEYYANRVSDGTLADVRLAEEEDMLAEALHDAGTAIDRQKLAYRFSHDLEALQQLAERKLAFIALTLGYVLGRHAARGLTSPITDKLQAELQRSALESAFSRIREELARLYKERATWQATTCIQPLEQIWQEVMAGFGLHYEDQDTEGVYIRVP